jgi:TonB-linked SusC/RagA family outer membrane protein
MSLRRAILSAVASALLIVVLPLAAHAQQGTIRGTVTAEAGGEPLAGARISIIGSNRFAQSAADGTYELTEVRAGQVQLRVAIIGYQSQAATLSVTAGQTATLDFTLPAAVFTLDAVVVTAVGEQSQREVANAIAAVDASKIQEAAPQSTIGELLQGKAPGVTIRQSSGTTGVGQSIKIRGNSSLNLGNTPLIYVDGARIDNDDITGPGIGGQSATRLNDINPEDIERIEVVKGPSASSLYGTEAAAGVIQIFTKKGRRGAPEFGFRSDFGANIKSTHTFAPSLWNPSVVNLGVGAFDTTYTMNLLEDYDPFSRGFIQTYAGSVRGGTDDLTYYVSGEYQDEEGTLPNNQFQRYYARGNFTITPSPTWDLQASGGYTSNFLTLPDNDNNGFGYIGVAQIGSPWNNWITASDPAGGGGQMLTCPLGLEFARSSGNTLADATDAACNLEGDMPPGFGGRRFSDVATLGNVQDVERFTGSSTLRVRPTSFWTNRFTLGYDLVDQRTAFLVPVNPDLPFGSASLGARGLSTQTNRNVTVDYSGSLNFGFGDVGTVTSFGFQWYRTVGETSGCNGTEFPGGATTCSDAVVTSGNENFNESKTLGLYVQEQLSYKDRLFVTPAVRFDDNSAFGQNFDIQTYPKIGVSFIAIDQPVSLIDQLKLRGSWGRSGKAPTNTAALTTFNSRGFTVFQQDVLGVTPNQPGNLDLAPEIGEEFEVGVDIGLINNRVGLEATYYNQRTTDVLVQRPLAPSIGFPAAVWDNLGRMDNQGVEFGLNVAASEPPGPNEVVRPRSTSSSASTSRR